jgi:hypothetical protein
MSKKGSSHFSQDLTAALLLRFLYENNNRIATMVLEERGKMSAGKNSLVLLYGSVLCIIPRAVRAAVFI